MKEAYNNICTQRYIRILKFNVLRYRVGAIFCCTIYYISSFGPIFFGILVSSYILFKGIIDVENSLLLILTLSATALSALGTFGNFKKQWHANRDAVYALRIIVNRCNIVEYVNQMQFIHDYELVIEQHKEAWEKAT